MNDGTTSLPMTPQAPAQRVRQRPPERMITIVWRQFRRHPMAIAGSTILLIIVLVFRPTGLFGEGEE